MTAISSEELADPKPPAKEGMRTRRRAKRALVVGLLLVVGGIFAAFLLKPTSTSRTYQAGYAYGRELAATFEAPSDVVSACDSVGKGKYSTASESSSFDSGCEAGFSSGIPSGNGSTTSTSSTSATPEEQFAHNAMSIPTVANAVSAGRLTTSDIEGYGDQICNLMPQYISSYGATSAFNEIANEFAEGLTVFRISGPDDGEWISLAINAICPQYSSDIPPGATG